MKEHLPDWAKEEKDAGAFFAWLNDGADGIRICSGFVLVKVPVKNCILIYTVKDHETAQNDRLHALQLCGIFRKTDGMLYEVGPVLHQVLKIPEGLSFPNKSVVQRELEEKVTIRGRERISKEWDQLVQRFCFTREQLIPVIDKEQINQRARRYLQMGKRSGQLVYLPKFSFASMQSELPDELFLRYLQEEKDAVEHTTEIWLKNCLPDIAKSRIYYGCVKEEMAELEKSRYAKSGREKGSAALAGAEKKTA